jgi:Holliday junction resolvase RusA-like endonuclease
VIPGLPKSPNDLLGAHWRQRSKHAKEWQEAVWAYLLKAGGKPPAPLTRARLSLIRYSSVEPDRDNLRGSFKAVVDGLVKAGVLVDDTSAVIGEPYVHWIKAPPRKGMIQVIVEECPAVPT